MFLPVKNTPRWIIFSGDLVICLLAFLLAYLVRFEFNVPYIEVALAKTFLPLFIIVRAASFVIGRTYAGIIRYTSTQDTLRIFTVLTLGSLLMGIMNVVRAQVVDDGRFFLPNSIIIIEYLLSLFALIVVRIAVKVMYIELKTPIKARKRIVIYGAGESGLITKRSIDRDSRSAMEVVAFLDDDKNKSGKKMEGADIYHTSKADDLFAHGKVEEIIIAIPSITLAAKQAMIQKALAYKIKISNIPPVSQWINGELSVRQIRDVRIEDLLGRDAIRLDSETVNQHIAGKVVLVTGAAGSIGSEIVRQVLAYQPKKLIAFDQAETPLFELENEIYSKGFADQCEFVIGDVRQSDRLRRLFDYFRPEIVFHAAAYKHVPLMENNPSEALLTNVAGTKFLADVAEEFSVQKFVFISTDKAVNPTSVMGASKRAAEIYIQAKNQGSSTKYITTRFGNVLGSNGSVIPIFKRQIENGGPVCVTHPEVRRFFMTIPEATQLVLEAGSFGQGGEIFAFDMGDEIKIADLAKNMITLSGLEVGKDIEIKFTGLRPGEKLYEEVLSNQETTRPTHHPKILIAEVRQWSRVDAEKEVDELIHLFDKQDNSKIVAKLKSMIPEYLSNNSEFERLDK